MRTFSQLPIGHCAYPLCRAQGGVSALLQRVQQQRRDRLSKLAAPARYTVQRLHPEFHGSRWSQLHPCRATNTDEEVDVETDAMDRMDTAVKVTKEKFATIRTGRATPSLLDLVKVDYYGAPTPLRSLANITAPEASLLVVSPFDKGTLEVIEKAIMQANLGFTPNNDGKLIRINVPQLTADRRKEMAKSVAKLGEEGKVAVRNVRRDAMKTLDQQEKAGDLSEDEKAALADSVQEITDESIKEIDKLIKTKQTELTTL